MASYALQRQLVWRTQSRLGQNPNFHEMQPNNAAVGDIAYMVEVQVFALVYSVLGTFLFRQVNIYVVVAGGVIFTIRSCLAGS